MGCEKFVGRQQPTVRLGECSYKRYPFTSNLLVSFSVNQTLVEQATLPQSGETLQQFRNSAKRSTYLGQTIAVGQFCDKITLKCWGHGMSMHPTRSGSFYL